MRAPTPRSPAQVLKLVAAKPDAVLIAASGTPAALPQKALKERGYTGKIYQTHGVANNDFLRVGGKDVEGTLPAGRPGAGRRRSCRRATRCKKSRARLRDALRGGLRQGLASRPSARHAWDAGLLMQRRRAAQALKKAQARHAGVPRRAARRARGGARSCPARTASSTCRRPTTSASTSARA